MNSEEGNACACVTGGVVRFVMFNSLFVCLFVVVWCGAGGAGGRTRRAEPLRNQVSMSCYRGRDKMQTDDMRRHCECMMLGFLLALCKDDHEW